MSCTQRVCVQARTGLLPAFALAILLLETRIASGQWTIEIVDSLGNSGNSTSMVIDNKSFPHVSHVESDGDLLKYTWKNESGWSTEVVDETFPTRTSMGLDSKGFPHIVYRGTTSPSYAFKDEAGWHIEMNPTGASYFVSLVMDSMGFPHLAGQLSYHAGNDADPGSRIDILRYAFHDGTEWTVETADDGTGTCGYFCSLKLDAADHPHISHWDANSWSLRYCYKTGAEWIAEVVSDQGGFDSSLALDSEGYPHIAYTDGDDVMYAAKTSSEWSVQTVTSSEGSVYYTSLCLDDLGHPHISYHNLTLGQLRYAFFDGSFWWIQTIDDNNAGRDNSLRLDQFGSPHASYYDMAEGDLNYARFEPFTDLSSHLVGPFVYLTWTVVPGACEYWIYGVSDIPYFVPDLSPPFANRLTILPQGLLSWLSPNQTGSPGFGWSYLVVATTVSGQEICRSKLVGEISYSGDIP
jgi:hypothetical protein